MYSGGTYKLAKLIAMCGLPASTKSTYALELSSQYDAIILSSDVIREELFNDVNFQGDNTKVFEVLHKRANQYLSEDKNVILDATNINRKRRIHLIKNEIKADEYHVYYMNTRIGHCLYNDGNRNRRVGYEVIDKMYKNLHIPTIREGWDSVTFVDVNQYKYRWYCRSIIEELLAEIEIDHDYLFEQLIDVIEEFSEIHNLPQDSTYHSFSVSRHTYHVYKYILDNYTGVRKKEMLVASLFHDLGKAHTKSFTNFKGEETKYASYINHENISAQLSVSELTALGYDDEFIKYVSDLIQFHMMPMNMSKKVEKKLRNLLSEEQFNDLLFLHEADLKAK